MSRDGNPMIPIHHLTLETLQRHLSRSNADYAEMAEKVIELTDANARLKAMVAELVDVYWGEGDSDPRNPPDIIKRAKRLLKST